MPLRRANPSAAGTPESGTPMTMAGRAAPGVGRERRLLGEQLAHAADGRRAPPCRRGGESGRAKYTNSKTHSFGSMRSCGERAQRPAARRVDDRPSRPARARGRSGRRRRRGPASPMPAPSRLPRAGRGTGAGSRWGRARRSGGRRRTARGRTRPRAGAAPRAAPLQGVDRGRPVDSVGRREVGAMARRAARRSGRCRWRPMPGSMPASAASSRCW